MEEVSILNGITNQSLTLSLINIMKPFNGLFSSQKSRILEPEAMEDNFEAEAYNALATRQSKFLYQPLFDTIDKLDLKGGRALDLGCGPGQVAIRLASKYPDMKIIGMDMSDTMLNLARTNAAEKKLDNISFIKGDVKRTPFDDASFDLVYSNFVIHHLPEPIFLFNETARLAGRQGAIIIRDLLRHAPWVIKFQALFSRVFLRYTAVQAKESAESLQASLTQNEIRRFLEKSRLSDICASEFSFFDFIVLRGNGDGKSDN